ncbi:MAG: hypothetical protein LBC93_08295 [Synergistaceae bacterium]|jgi:hypothetical protein|nr:hypothetical protein [Synergistaceae bacterium]
MTEFLELYAGGTTFRDHVTLDLEDGAVWFNPEEFGEYHEINKKRVLSVFAGDQRGQTIAVRTRENPEGIVKSRGILFVRSNEIEGVKAGQSLRLDGRLYTVAEARILQDRVWRIVLEANES